MAMRNTLRTLKVSSQSQFTRPRGLCEQLRLLLQITVISSFPRSYLSISASVHLQMRGLNKVKILLTILEHCVTQCSPG